MQQRRPQPGRIAGNLLPGITPQSLKEVKCNCGSVIFTPAFQVRLASPLQTANGQPTMVQFPMGYMCTQCKKVNDFPKEVEKEVQDDSQVPQPDSGGGDLGVSVSEKVKSGEALG